MSMGVSRFARSKWALAGVLCVVTALALVVALRLSLSGADSGLREYRVARLPVGIWLMERGILVPKNTVPVELKASGEIVEILKSGTRVTKGDRVIRIDDGDLRDRVLDRELDLQTTQTGKEVHEAELELAKVEEANRLRLVKAQLEHARLSEAVARAGLTESDRRLLAIEEAMVKLDLADAQDELNRQERLFKRGFVSEASLDPFRRRTESVEAALEEVALKIRLREKGEEPERLLELKQNVQQLDARYKRGGDAMRRRLNLIEQTIRLAETQIARNENWLAHAREELANTDVPAPADGIVALRLYRDWRSGGRWGEYKPGIRKWKNDRLADIVNLGIMSVFLMIHEADVQHVREGMKTEIKVPAYPDRSFSGEVVEVGGVGQDRFDVAPVGYERDRTDVTMFNAAVSLEAADTEFRPGMSALVKILVEPPKPRLVVPRGAVRRKDEAYRVSRKRGRRFKETTVEGGPLGLHHFLVTKGLEEGDIVGIPK
jgi:HlyD family secretion protein